MQPYNSCYIYIEYEGNKKDFESKFEKQMKEIAIFVNAEMNKKIRNPKKKTFVKPLYTICSKPDQHVCKINVLFHPHSKPFVNVLMGKNIDGTERVENLGTENWQIPKERIQHVYMDLETVEDELISLQNDSTASWGDIEDLHEERNELLQTLEDLWTPKEQKVQLEPLVKIQTPFENFTYGREHFTPPARTVGNVLSTIKPISWAKDPRIKNKISAAIKKDFSKYVSDFSKVKREINGNIVEESYPHVDWAGQFIHVTFDHKNKDARMALHMCGKAIWLPDLQGKMQKYPVWYLKYENQR